MRANDRERADLVQDLLAHAHEAPEHCSKLMRAAARELTGWFTVDDVTVVGPAPFPPAEDPRNPREKVKGAPSC